MVDRTTEADPRFVELRQTGSPALRDLLVEDHLRLARAFARRYDNRGVALDDLEQVARVGLVLAVDRYDPDVGVKFSTFAGRTIDGELKRYFRDRAWALRVPRRAKDLGVAVRRSIEELTQALGRSPTTAELAERVGAEPDEVLEALDAGAAFRVGSIDAPDPDSGGSAADGLGEAEGGYGSFEDADLVGRLLDRLSERERRIVELRFFEELSQREIAEQVGVSQMHVSRLLARALEAMRTSEAVEPEE